MKIYLYNETDNIISEHIGAEKIDFNKWNILLVQRMDGDSEDLSPAEVNQLNKLVGYKNIESSKIKIYTPELLLQEKHSKDAPQSSMIKLGDNCIIYKNGEAYSCFPLEVKEVHLLKHLNAENVCVFGDEELGHSENRCLNHKIKQENKNRGKYKQLFVIATGLFVLLNIGLIYYEHKLSETVDLIAPVATSPIDEEYDGIRGTMKKVDSAIIRQMDVFQEVDFDVLSVRGASAILIFRNRSMEQVITDLAGIESKVKSAKIINVNEDKAGGFVTVEVKI